MRAACVIAVEKAKSSFEPMLEALRHRSVHIMRRLFPVVEDMVRRSSGSSIDNYNGPLQNMVSERECLSVCERGCVCVC